MNTLFAETLKRLRTERGLSQVELGKRMFSHEPPNCRRHSALIGNVHFQFQGKTRVAKLPFFRTFSAKTIITDLSL